MNDNIDQFNLLKDLFESLEKLFLSSGYKKDQIISMDVTAGKYLVTNPDSTLPKIICSVNDAQEFTLEITQVKKEFFNIIKQLLNEIITFPVTDPEIELTNTINGVILEDLSGFQNFDLFIQNEFFEILRTNLVQNKPVKLIMSFNIAINSIASVKNKIDSIIDDNNVFEQEVLNIINKRPKKSIQSKHIAEQLSCSKEKSLKCLKVLVEKKMLVRSGSWFFIITNQQ